MAEAKQCDRCGALYKNHYKSASMNIDNGESDIYIVACYRNRRVDLCEKCTRLFERFMNNKRIEFNEKPKLVEDNGFVQSEED